MRGVLVQQKVSKAITDEFPDTMTDDQKEESDELAYTSIILHLSDQVLRKVGKHDTAKALWDELEKLYIPKSLPNKLFLLEKFFSFRIDPTRDLEDSLDIFNKLVQDIINTGEKVSDEYKTVVLLNAIPEAYKEVKDAIKYGRDTLTPDIVIDSLRSKELELKSERGNSGHENLFARGRTLSRSSGTQESHNNQGNNSRRKFKSRCRSKSRTRTKKCYGCGKSGHFIKDCYKKKNEQKQKGVDEGNVIESEGSATVDVYAVTENLPNSANVVDKNQNQEWILDSGCTFHMTYKRAYLDNFKKIDGGEVVMGNNVACRVEGVENVTLKFDNGYIYTL